jgi:hypothetical protein
LTCQFVLLHSSYYRGHCNVVFIRVHDTLMARVIFRVMYLIRTLIILQLLEGLFLCLCLKNCVSFVRTTRFLPDIRVLRSGLSGVDIAWGRKELTCFAVCCLGEVLVALTFLSLGVTPVVSRVVTAAHLPLSEVTLVYLEGEWSFAAARLECPCVILKMTMSINTRQAALPNHRNQVELNPFVLAVPEGHYDSRVVHVSRSDGMWLRWTAGFRLAGMCSVELGACWKLLPA